MTRLLHAGLAPDYLEYHRGWELQRRVHREVVAGDADDTLIVCEHLDVYTAGKRTEPGDRPTDGTPVVDVDRGGKLTWHGPGQLVGYPIMRLPEPVDVVGFVRWLEEALIGVLSGFGVAGEQVEGRSGVWVRSGGEVAKIAAIGLRVKEGVTMHGFALNCSNDLAPFSSIVPCGIRDAGVTTATAASGRLIVPADVVDAVAARFKAVPA